MLLVISLAQTRRMSYARLANMFARRCSSTNWVSHQAPEPGFVELEPHHDLILQNPRGGDRPGDRAARRRRRAAARNTPLVHRVQHVAAHPLQLGVPHRLSGIDDLRHMGEERTLPYSRAYNPGASSRPFSGPRNGAMRPKIKFSKIVPNPLGCSWGTPNDHPHHPEPPFGSI